MEPDGRVTWMNDVALEFLGLCAEDLSESDWRARCYHPDEFQRLTENFFHHLARGLPFATEQRLRGSNGSYRWFVIHYKPQKDAGGQVTRWYGSGIDIEDRKRAEALWASERNLSLNIDAIPTPLASARPDGYADFHNQSFLDYTGLSAEEAQGSGWAVVIHPNDAEGLLKGWQSSLVSGAPLEAETRMRRFDGVYRWFLCRANPLRDESGAILKWYAHMVDIDDRKRAEALLARENHILEMVAKGESLPEILNALCRAVEETADGALASILLLDGNCLRHGASPSLPKEYTDAIDGAPIGAIAGSCGTAAYRRGQVIVEDIATDLLWADYKELALPHSLRACWSTPVFSSRGEVVATFAMYYREPRRPDDTAQEMIRQIAHLAGIAIERKLTQDALGNSEAYLSEAQRVAHLGTWVWDAYSRKLVYVSDEWHRIFGFDPELGPPSWEQRLERVHPEDRDRYAATVDRAIAEKTDYEIEYRVVLPNGAMKYLLAIGHPVANQSGELVNFVGILSDITERRQVELALRAAMDERTRLSTFREEIGVALSRQEDLKAILHSCAGAVVRHLDAAFARIWTLTSDGRDLELQASAGMYTHLDGPHSRIPVGQFKIGLIAQERMPHFTNEAQSDPRVSDREWARREKMISFAGYPLVLEDRLVGVMGMFSQKPLSESTLEALSFAAGIIAQGIERRRAEDALRRSEAYLAEGQRLTHTGSWGLNVVTQEALHSSAEHSRLFGFDPEKDTPTFADFFQRVHPEDQEHVLQTFQALVQSGGDLNLRYRTMAPGSPVRYLHAMGRPVRRQSGGVPGEYVGITIDVTERRRSDQERERLRQLEADLAHMNRVSMMGELAASLAHELNQPIAAAITNAGTCLRWLTRDEPDLEEAREAATRIFKDGTRAAEITHRMRSFYKKGAPAQPELVDVAEIVREITALLRNEAARWSVSVHLELADGIPQVTADRVQLQQVFMNLMLNAIEAMRETAGELKVKSRLHQDGQLLISVSDNGVGLPAENAEKIFEAFFTTKPQGTGMGLAITRSIIEAHGGCLWATGNAGRGATFQFTLPLAGAEIP
jgi:PAS domain S-box-containing protein